MSRNGLICLLVAAFAVLATAAPAHAGEVIVVDGDRAVRTHDPAVPTRAETYMRARAPRPVAVASSRGTRAVSAALRRALARRSISRARHDRYRRAYRAARGQRRRLRGARRAQLGYVIGSLETMAIRGRLSATRMPTLFAQLERNTRFWRSSRYPAAGAHVSFRGSEVLYQYYPGRGLQLQPLATFKKANNLHGACTKGTGACSRARLARLLDEMTALATRRSRRFIAWEYLFSFGGGAPPWMSGMAQATGIQALGRAGQLLGRPRYLATARRALPAFEVGPPTGVRARGPRGGVHYLQYSFAPRLFIFNAFLQSLIGLHDFDAIASDAKAAARYREAEPEARRELPYSDVGDWSRYSYRGAESNGAYHELLREFLASMCSRRLGRPYCDFARRYRGYQVDPPVLRYSGPATAAKGRVTRLRFTISKLSVAELTVYKGSRLAHRRLATFRRGSRWFSWRPRSAGDYTVRIAAKELRTGMSKRGRTSGTLVVAD